MSDLEIVWTKVDEAPALATYSLLPIVKAFVGAAGMSVKRRTSRLPAASSPTSRTTSPRRRRHSDDLAELGELATRPEANIIKLPNISASIPQLKAAIKELQGQGYDIPDYPEDAEDRRPRRTSRRATAGSRQRRQPGAARRQFRPPRAGAGQALRAQAPAQDGRLERGLEVARGAHDGRRLLRLGSSTTVEGRDQRAHRARRRRRQRPRC